MDNVTKTFRNKLGRLPQRTCGPSECQNHLSETFHKNKDWMVPSDGRGYSCTSNISDIFKSIQSLQKIAFGFALMFHSDSFVSAVRHKSLFVRTFFVDKGQPFILQCFVQVCVYTACVSVCVWVRVCLCACVRAHHSALYRHGWDDLFHFICQLLLLSVLILLQRLNDLTHTGK